MALEGRKICEAGKKTADKTCGHHHILIDSKPVATGEAIINDATHLHFGKGQTETDVTLAPGKNITQGGLKRLTTLMFICE
jgi:hypothetical protein